MSEKIRENRLRRIAKRHNYHFIKSRIRDPHAVGFGCYDLFQDNCGTALDFRTWKSLRADMDRYGGESIFGSGPTGQPRATLDEIEEFLDGKGAVHQARSTAFARKIGLTHKT